MPITDYFSAAFEQAMLERVCPYTGRLIWIYVIVPSGPDAFMEDIAMPCPECKRDITVDVSPPW